METNTVTTLIDYVKDITGQDNLSDAKAIRALNFATDHYSYIAITSSGRWQWDSNNQSDMSRITATITSVNTKIELETELMTLQKVEIQVNGKYQPIEAIDIKDAKSQSLDSEYSTAGTPIYYDYDSQFLYIYPVSDSSRTIRVTYSRPHPRFTTGNLTQNTGVTPVHEEYLAMYAADRVMIGVNDPSRVQIRNELSVMEAEIRDLFSRRDQDTPRVLKAKMPDAFMGSSRPNR